MNAPSTRRPADRDRAVDRIRRLTIGTTVAGIVAVGGFGGLAAATWRGADAQVTTAAVTTTGDDTASGSDAGSSTASDDGTSTANDDATSTTSPAAIPDTQATTPTVTTTGGSAHATTGGS